jgi:hypothetical protein
MNLKKRIFRDFIMPSRVNEYDAMLEYAKEHGYEFHTLRSFIQLPTIEPGKKYMVLRRDVDTASNRIQWGLLKAEIKNGARCSSYFRRNTINKNLMKSIEENGGEAAYHYEEIATWCYKHRERRKDEVLKHLDEFREMFVVNVEKMRKECEVPALTVSSHGEYVNRKLDIDNRIIADETTLKKCNILMDAYDTNYVSKCTVRIHDHDRDNFIEDVKEAVKNGEPVIEILTHPRQWGAAIIPNLLDDINRFFKQLYMGL